MIYAWVISKQVRSQSHPVSSSIEVICFLVYFTMCVRARVCVLFGHAVLSLCVFCCDPDKMATQRASVDMVFCVWKL